jgi:transposase
MIAASAGVKIMVATKPVDFRKGADGLVALVREQLCHDPFAGTIFVFRSKHQPSDVRVALFLCGDARAQGGD